MRVYPYIIKLIDPLFYSQEALSGAYTQIYLHATAINHAVSWCMGRVRDDQSYVISDEGGGRNIPRYEHSWIEPDFYFTPASIEGKIEYIVETIKGDMDYFIQPGFGIAKILGKSIGRNEVLKAYRIFSLLPETIFNGYLHLNNDILEKFPNYIRLGSFRGKAELLIGKEKYIHGIVPNQYVNHPVDPLVSKVKRGVMIGMFPYPIVDNAFVEDTYEIRESNHVEFIAVPSRYINYDADELLNRLNDLKPGLQKAKDVSLTLKDRAYLILHMLRVVYSIKFFLIGISGEERLNSALREIEGFENIRLASKGENIHIDQTEILGFIEKIERAIETCEEKIKRDPKSRESENTRKSSSNIIL